MALVAGALLAAASAHAQAPTTVVADSPYVERVAYQPAELASADGVRRLQGRVRKASHRVCAPSQPSWTASYNELRCYNATLTDALAQVDQAVARWASGDAPKRIMVAAR